MRLRIIAASAAAALLLSPSVPARASRDPVRCGAPEGVTRLKVPLPNTARAVRRARAVIIVSIGSSSTQGAGASSPAKAYPAVLAGELRRRWPHLPVAVLNMGVGGELADQMLSRFEDDVMPYRPHLVIWQTGSNQVVRRGDLKGYADTVRRGIKRLKAAGMDVVLMDPQYAPRILARPVHRQIVDSISAVASDTKVAHFRRFAVMRHWVESGRHKMEEIVHPDKLHMNDMSYRCLALLLADSLTAAVRAAPPQEEAPPLAAASGRPGLSRQRARPVSTP